MVLPLLTLLANLLMAGVAIRIHWPGVLQQDSQYLGLWAVAATAVGLACSVVNVLLRKRTAAVLSMLMVFSLVGSLVIHRRLEYQWTTRRQLSGQLSGIGNILSLHTLNDTAGHNPHTGEPADLSSMHLVDHNMWVSDHVLDLLETERVEAVCLMLINQYIGDARALGGKWYELGGVQFSNSDADWIVDGPVVIAVTPDLPSLIPEEDYLVLLSNWRIERVTGKELRSLLRRRSEVGLRVLRP